MNKWARVSLGELLTLERRPVKVAPDSYYEEIGIYCFGRGIFHKPPRSGLEVGEKDLFLIKSGDFILQITFAWEGAVAVASAAEDEMYGSVRFPTFRVNEGKCDPRYLLNYFRTHEGREQLVRICPGSAGRNRVLSIKRLPEVTVPLPPLSEQQRIAAKIDELADRIDEARRLCHQATEETHALVKSGINNVISITAKKWDRKPIYNVANAVNGFGFPKIFQGEPDLPYPFIKVSDMNLPGNERYILATQNTVDDMLINQMKARVYPRGTLTFPKIGGAIATNKRRILSKPGTFDNNVMGIVPSSQINPEWLYYFMLSVDLTNLQAGTSVPAVKQSKVEELEIPVPPLSEQQQIVEYLDDFTSKMENLRRTQVEITTELDALMPSILDKAFKGEL